MTAKDDDQAPWDDVPNSVRHGDGLDWDALAAKAMRREQLIARLEKLAAYTPDNLEEGEYTNAQAAIKKIKAEVLALTPTEVAPLLGLSDVLESIVAEVNRFIVLRERDAQIMALWIVHTHVFVHLIEDGNAGWRSIFDHTPRLMVWSPIHGSGKSTAAEIISRLAANVELISSLTGGELKAFMRGEAEKRNNPVIQSAYKDSGLLGLGLHTYLFDEAEQYKYTGLLMRLMNAGHRHDGQIWDGKGGKISAYAPMAIFRRFDPHHEPGLAPTVSRSVLVEMQKRDPKNPDDKREPLRARNPYVRRLTVLKQQIERVVARLISDFTAWRPEANFLEGNRNADNWEPLIAIADLAGGDWPTIARELAAENARELEKREAEEIAASYGDAMVHDGHRPPRRPRSAAEEISGAKERIMHYLRGRIRRCSRSDLHKWVFSNNLKAEFLEAAITALEAEGQIRTGWQRTGAQSGRSALMVELVGQSAAANSDGAAEDLRDTRESADPSAARQPGWDGEVFSDEHGEQVLRRDQSGKATCDSTDKKIMDPLHEVLGPCELDAASPPVPVHVQARRWYALERGEDGLTLSWLIPNDGDAWLYLNCPWGEGKGEPSPFPEWAAKMCSEVGCGNVRRAVTLWPYSPDTRWYKTLMTIAGIQEIRITRKGLRFGNTKNGPSGHIRVLALLTIGLRPEEIAALREALTRHGVDVVAESPPPSAATDNPCTAAGRQSP